MVCSEITPKLIVNVNEYPAMDVSFDLVFLLSFLRLVLFGFGSPGPDPRLMG